MRGSEYEQLDNTWVKSLLRNVASFLSYGMPLLWTILVIGLATGILASVFSGIAMTNTNGLSTDIASLSDAMSTLQDSVHSLPAVQCPSVTPPISDSIGAPVNGKVGVGFGATTPVIESYLSQVAAVNSRAPWPYYVMDWTNFDAPNFGHGFPLNNADLLGNYQTGVFPGASQSTYIASDMDMAPSSVILVAVNGNVTFNQAWAAIGSGLNPYGVPQWYINQLKAGINSFIAYANSLPNRKFIVLWEAVDWPLNGQASYATGGNATYVQWLKDGFRGMAGVIHANAPNVAMAWGVFGMYFPTSMDFSGLYNSTDPTHLSSWYPGDDVVDWIAVDYYLVNISYQVRGTYPAAQTRDAVYAFARAHNKPIVVTQQFPVGIYSSPTLNNGNPFIFVFACEVTPPFQIVTASTTVQEIWNYYFTPMLAEIKANSDVLKLFMWTNGGADGPPTPANPSGFAIGFGGLLMQENPYLASRFFAALSDPSTYVQMPRPTYSPAINGPLVASADQNPSIGQFTVPAQSAQAVFAHCWNSYTQSWICS